MRSMVLAAALLFAAGPAPAQTAPAAPPAAAPQPAAEARPGDVASVDAIVAALYDVISGEAGEARDWARFHGLFLPGAIMGGAGRGPDGTARMRVSSPADYVTRNTPHFQANAFYEREIGRRVTRFGPLIQVLSAYEIRTARDAAEPVQRGVNAITLFDDGQRLWVTSVTWAGETAETPIPADLLAGS
ncbi:hypothetical protein [Brevundimonas sp.]|uniref:hypothetical protein n=1 Tax=Brevundimonas sp. TaxID=1871086 RepID=UPI002ED77CA9